MKANGSIRHLVAQLAERAERAEEKLARLETRMDDELPREEPARFSRAVFLGRAGAAAAGAAGALLVSGRSASAADGGAVVLGNSGDTNNPNLAELPTEVRLDGSVTPTPKVILLGNDTTFSPTNAAYPAAVAGWGNTRNGVYGYSNSGDGVVAFTNGGAPAVAVRAIGSGGYPGRTPPSGTGLLASGGTGPGVIGAGDGYTGGAITYSTGWPFAGSGVYGTGGAPHNGPGLLGLGGGTTGEGLIALAAGWPSAAAGAVGVKAYGGNLGVYGTGTDGVEGYGAPAGVGVRGYGGTGLFGDGSASGRGAYLIGGRAPLTLVPAAAPGPPTSLDHFQGDIVVDNRGTVWACTVAGTPGTFEALQQGGLGNALFTAVSTMQYKLANSDGVTWVDLDATNLKLTITPAFNCQGIFSANSDLWTSVATFNQDIAIFISGGTYGAGQVVAWKESGGFAGTFSPNAAFVETVQPLVAGTTYTVKVQWKANRPGTSTIWAGAGPIPAGSSTFSPTRLTALLILTA